MNDPSTKQVTHGSNFSTRSQEQASTYKRCSKQSLIKALEGSGDDGRYGDGGGVGAAAGAGGGAGARADGCGK